jgi:hypothetical protein
MDGSPCLAVKLPVPLSPDSSPVPDPGTTSGHHPQPPVGATGAREFAVFPKSGTNRCSNQWLRPRGLLNIDQRINARPMTSMTTARSLPGGLMLPHRPKSRRLALSVTAAALLAASPLLAACGGTAYPGAAAVVDGDRITVSQLQARVADVRDAQRGSAQSAQLIQDTGQLSRATLNSMIFDRILARAAKDAGVTVSRSDVQEARTAAERSAGGADRLRQMWLQQYAIGPGQVEATIRNQVAMDKLAQALGADRNSPEGQAKIVDALRAASTKMGIDINPRFGTWDDKQVLLGNAKVPWLRDTQPADEQA